MKKQGDQGTVKSVLRQCNAEQGFTLVEMMVVITLIALLAGLVAVNAFGVFTDNEEKITAMAIKNVRGAVVGYMLHSRSRCPQSLDELYDKEYLENKPLDAWGETLHFKCPAERGRSPADIWSAGKDRIDGTDDDIVSWEAD